LNEFAVLAADNICFLVHRRHCI